MNSASKLSLRDKIFRHLSNVPNRCQQTEIVSCKQICEQNTDNRTINVDSDTDSEGSLDDHLVNLEDIDLDSQFFSQDYNKPTQVSITSGIDVEKEEQDYDSNLDLCNTEETRIVYEKLTQLANHERTHNETRELLRKTGVRIKTEPISECLTNHIVIEDDSEEEWVRIENSNEEKPTNSVEVLIGQGPKKCAKILDVDAQFKRLLQNQKREKQLILHKTHLLCLLGHGFYLNRLVNEMVLNHGQKLLEILQYVSEDILENLNFDTLKRICNAYRALIKLQPTSQKSDNHKSFCTDIFTDNYLLITSKEFYVMLFTAVLRFLSFEVRLVLCLNVLPKSVSPNKNKSQTKANHNVKASSKSNDCTSDDRERYPDVPLTTTEILKRKPELAHFSQIPQMDGIDDHIEEKRPRLCEVSDSKPKLWKLKRLNNIVALKSTLNHPKSRTTSDIKSPYFSQVPKKTNKKGSVNPVNRNPALSIWIEVMLDKRWHPVDILSGNVDCLDYIINALPQPPAYIFGWCGDETLHDVTPRYWWRNEVGARKLRISDKWRHPVILHFGRKRKDLRDLLDVREFRQLRYRAPIPDKVSEFKNHPSYCLKRDLLKFQAIYPVDAPPLGFFRGEPIYARECVHTLHSREVWLRHAKTIRLYEQPYKIVSSKLKREKTDLELFGYWQTEEYIPPEAQNGRVPRNAYGNIEIFKDCMLPKGTVHLKQINISKICRRLKVDYATAVVGFGVHAGGNHPVFEGIVICKEFEEHVLQEYERDKLEQEQRKHLHRERTIYANWRKLIKGMLIRSRLKHKYNFENL
ncbi:DNA repair protein complementing XP-C cells homolog [Sabethes cyaneus]|uniref:DNA repair protein complementing XP-C cells homolog n=1 Tax=Sabethes cyaneus TaxID=53552 RepID=UPI00237D61E0|nr:DNA repair protein complementing XP-C cells homolog [Sabethes cyaneus]